jgi:hypothetical protein
MEEDSASEASTGSLGLKDAVIFRITLNLNTSSSNSSIVLIIFEIVNSPLPIHLLFIICGTTS